MKRLILILVPILLLGLLLAACTDNDRDATNSGNLPDLSGQTAASDPSLDPDTPPAEPGGTSRPDNAPSSGQPEGPASTDDLVSTAETSDEEGGLPVEDEVVVTVTGNVVIGGN